MTSFGAGDPNISMKDIDTLLWSMSFLPPRILEHLIKSALLLNKYTVDLENEHKEVARYLYAGYRMRAVLLCQERRFICKAKHSY